MLKNNVTQHEKLICERFRTLLEPLNINDRIPDNETFEQILCSLETFVNTQLQCTSHKFWKWETLDGIYNTITALKNGENEASVLCMCILISNQTVVPFHIHFKLDEKQECFKWYIFKIGEETEDGLKKISYGSSKLSKYMFYLENNDINWMYEFSSKN